MIQITVDQLRGDLLMRYSDRLDGGLRYLIDQGAWFTDAHHPHAHTETIVGHTTLVTGAYPSRHGMVGNSWYDRRTGAIVKNVEDATAFLVDPPEPGKDREPSVSPRNILTSTIGDEMTLATVGQAKVFSVAQKDRAAVAMAGHTGKAFWFRTRGTAAGRFVSSTFYYNNRYPRWVDAWNAEKRPDRYSGQEWSLLRDRNSYLFRAWANDFCEGQDANDCKNFLPERAMAFLDRFGFKRTFPHAYGEPGARSFFYDNLTLAPASDQLTAEFAKAIIENEGLGQDDIPDFLGVGFSATDIVGHWFGPSSLESEDNILQLDKTLGDFFAFVDTQVGLQNTLIVLAGDHGMPEFPEILEKLHINSGRVSQGALQHQAALALASEYGGPEAYQALARCIAGCQCSGKTDECKQVQSCLAGCPESHEFLLQYKQPYVYLDHDTIAEQGLSSAEVEGFLVGVLTEIEGVALAVSASELRAGGEALDTEMVAKIRRNQHPERSGDIYVVQESYWQMDETTASGEAPPGAPLLLQHGSPWAYDTFVPVIFAGGQVPAAKVERQVSTADVAPTVAKILGIRMPSGSVGQPLIEILGRAEGLH